MTALLPPPKEVTIAPHEMDAEQELLGAMMINNSIIEKIAGILRVEHFFHESHRRIYDAILKLNNRGELATPPTLSKYFRTDELLAQIGGTAYLARLAAACTSVIAAPDYAKAIRRTAAQRRIMQVATRAYEMVSSTSPDEDFEADLAELAAAFDEARALGTEGSKIRGIAGLAEVALQNADRNYKGARDGIPTGIGDLDSLFGGFAPKQLILLAARPSMGKSALALQMALNVAYTGRSVLFFSHEMSGEEFGERALSNWSGVPYADMATGRLNDRKFSAMVTAKSRKALDGAPLRFGLVDQPSMTVTQIKRHCRQWQRQQGLDLVVVDHLGLLRPERQHRGRTEDVSEISAALKAMAMDLNVPVLALSQLNRDLERREDKRPMLSDLRDSGSLEQDADTVMFVFREEYYLELSKPAENDPDFAEWQSKMETSKGICEVILAKQRRGRKGKAAIWFEPATNRFDDLSKRENNIDPRQEGFQL